MHKKLPWKLSVAMVALVGAAAAAQDGSIATPPPFAVQEGPSTRGIYSTKPESAPAQNTYSTKPAPQPWQQPVTQDVAPSAAPFARAAAPAAPPAGDPNATPARQVPVGNVPFGRAAPEVYAPVPTGPRDMTAAPVQDIGVVSEDLAPAKPAAAVPLPPKDPTEPTPQTTPIFEAEGPNTVPLRHVVLRGLNKVTGHTTRVEGMTGEVLRFGNLEVITKSCRQSAPTSQRDYAALLDIRELKPDAEPKPLFSGWMYASSPSLMALEHPVYDITVLECAVSKSAKAKTTAPAAKPKV